MENQQPLAEPKPVTKEIAETPKKDVAKPLVDDKTRQKLAKAVMETDTSVLKPVEYAQLRKLATDYHAAKALPKSYEKPEQILLAMQFGRTMGMSPYEAVINGYFVNGSYNVWGKAVPAALRRHGWTWRFENEVDDSCTVIMFNPRLNETIEDTFTYQDAIDSGFTKDNYGKDKVGWRKGANRKRKLRYGVLSQVLHTYVPEVLGAVGGIAEYSEDYADAEVNHAQDKTVTMRANIEAADAEFLSDQQDDFHPEPVAEEKANAAEPSDAK